MMATAFYLTGYLSHRTDVMNHHGSSWMVSLLAIPAVAAMFLDLGMVTTIGFEIILYYIVAMCGIFGVFEHFEVDVTTSHLGFFQICRRQDIVYFDFPLFGVQAGKFRVYRMHRTAY